MDFITFSTCHSRHSNNKNNIMTTPQHSPSQRHSLNTTHLVVGGKDEHGLEQVPPLAVTPNALPPGRAQKVEHEV
jgi:hypothetical protein